MWIDLAGTWLFGVPLGITMILFKKRCWMNCLQ